MKRPSIAEPALTGEDDSDDDISEIIKRRRLQKKQQAAALAQTPAPGTFAAMKENIGSTLNISNVTDTAQPRTQAEKDAESRAFKEEIESVPITADFSENPQEKIKPFKFQLAPEHFLLWFVFKKFLHILNHDTNLAFLF